MTDLPRITETWHWYEGNYVAGESPYMGRSNFGKWVTVEHAADIIVKYQHRLEAAEERWLAQIKFNADLANLRDSLRTKLVVAESECARLGRCNEQISLSYAEVVNSQNAKLAAATKRIACPMPKPGSGRLENAKTLVWP